MVAGDPRASTIPPATTLARARRAWLVKLLIGALIGALVGALAGWLVFRTAATESTATAYLRLMQPVDLTAVAASASQTTPDTMDNARRYVSGEVAFLSGDGFAQVLARKVGRSKPVELGIEHDEESAVVGITGSADDDDAARRIVQAAVDVYTQDLAQRVDQQLRTILPAFDQWGQAAQQSGDSDRAREIQKLRENVLLQAQSSSMVVLQAPTVNSSSGSDWLMGALMGAILGGAAVPLAMSWRRRRAGRVTSFDDVAGIVSGSLLPAVDVGHPPDPRRRSADAAVARTLYAQCQCDGPAPTIVVIGAAETSGASTIVSLLQFAAGESTPATATGATTVDVVDAGTIGRTPRTPEAIAAATEVLVVAEIGVDTVTEVLTVRASVPTAMSVRAVLTYRSSRGSVDGGRGGSHSAGSDEQQTAGRS